MEQRKFEDEWDYHPQTLQSFLFWHLSLFKISHFTFTFFQIYITEQLLNPENQIHAISGTSLISGDINSVLSWYA